MFEEGESREQKLAEGRKRLQKHLKRAKSRITSTGSAAVSTNNKHVEIVETATNTCEINDNNKNQMETDSLSLVNGNLGRLADLQYTTGSGQQQIQHRPLSSSTPQSSKNASPMSIGSSLLDENDQMGFHHGQQSNGISSEQQTIDTLIHERNELRHVVTTRERQLAETEKKIRELQQAHHEHRLQIQNLEMKVKGQAVTITQQNDNSRQYEALHTQLKQVVQETKRKCDSALQQRDELQSKLSALHQESTQWKAQVTALQSQLAKQTDRDLIEQNNRHLEARVKELCRDNEQLMAEREAVTRRYRDLAPKHEQAINQMKIIDEQRKRFHQMAQESTTQLQELSNQHQAALTSIKQLESELQSQQQPSDASAGHLKELQEKETVVAQQKHENDTLKAQVHEAQNRILELEEQSRSFSVVVEQRRGDAETVSRATSQNKQLKEQLLELQDAYVAATTQNMELATQLDTVKRYSRTIAEKLDNARSGKTDDEVAHLKHLLAAKTKVVDSLEDELSAAQETIEHMTNQTKTDNATKAPLEPVESEVALLETSNEGETRLEEEEQQQEQRIDENVKDDMHVLLRKQVHRLQLEKESLEADLQELQEHLVRRTSENSELETQLNEYKEEAATMQQRSTSYDFSSTEGARAAASLVGKLKYEIMELKAQQDELQSQYQYQFDLCNDLREKLTREEKINDQLSAESESVGDYITLYQSQRDKVAMRLKQKDDFIKKMIAEKLKIEANMEELQNVTRTLMEGKELRRRSPGYLQKPSRKNPLSDLVAPGGDEEDFDDDLNETRSADKQAAFSAAHQENTIRPNLTELTNIPNDRLAELLTPICVHGSLVVKRCGSCEGGLTHL